jgi:hypothetical protein
VTRFDKLFLGVAVERPPWIPATIEGIEHIGPEDTFDGDYGRLLEAAQNRGKGLASPTGHALMWKPKIQGKAQIAA